MDRNDRRETDELSDGLAAWSRRNLLRLTGAGVGVAALGGMSPSIAAQEDETPASGGDDSDAVDDRHFLADLVDPVFGYPLAGEETDDVSVEHVVEANVQEGQGAHENFPQEPDAEVPGSFIDLPVEFFFDPVGIHVEPGDLVHFNMVGGLHTVTAFHEKHAEPGLDLPTRVPEGVPGFTSPPLSPGESWVYQFTEKGVYDYFCFPHLGLGMVGRIVVLDPAEDDPGSEEFAAPSAGELFPNDERVLTAGELNPENVVQAGSVAWADLSLSPESTAEASETGSDPGNETGTEIGNETGAPTATGPGEN